MPNLLRCGITYDTTSKVPSIAGQIQTVIRLLYTDLFHFRHMGRRVHDYLRRGGHTNGGLHVLRLLLRGILGLQGHGSHCLAGSVPAMRRASWYARRNGWLIFEPLHCVSVNLETTNARG